MLNTVILQGRLVTDPELRHTSNGTAVVSFRLAVERDYKNQSTSERGVDFINIVAWRNTAEFVSKYFTKGRMAVVEGRLQMRNYTDRDGNKRISAEVVANSAYFCDSKKESAGDRGGCNADSYVPSAGQYGTMEELPFLGGTK